MSSMIKGILSLESAEIAINEGIDGIIVSNHIALVDPDVKLLDTAASPAGCVLSSVLRAQGEHHRRHPAVFHEARVDATRFEATATRPVRPSIPSSTAGPSSASSTRALPRASFEIQSIHLADQTTGPYMEMLLFWMCGPLGQRPDGRPRSPRPWSRPKTLASLRTTLWPPLAARPRGRVRALRLGGARGDVARVTGRRAEYLLLSLDEWIGVWDGRGQRPRRRRGMWGVDTAIRVFALTKCESGPSLARFAAWRPRTCSYMVRTDYY
ncbi:uncharacterized protein BXZ73DRAFT_108638 [Epithele typhae]|uniref:uncharacterized protein n=1 Tax=Epithele typhae TaxID=378194 RepID=UPI0020081110|nr:uncharacterized protein BXZ73DRAFT_108638 [Epithele typhae]KAH9910685.1 hypothetical protein BXZ73DRAFT_108638 [Epithele typhae]